MSLSRFIAVNIAFAFVLSLCLFQTVLAGDDAVIDPTPAVPVDEPGEDDRGGDEPGEDNRGGDQPAADPSVALFDPINKSIEEIFLAILDIILVFAVPIILFFIVWAGFLYVTAQGSEDQVKKATTALTYAVIGGLIVLGARVLLAVITNTINAFV